MATINDRQSDEQNQIYKLMAKYKEELVICKKFGCGRTLTLQEQRMGDYCLQHWDKDEVPIVKGVKIKWR